jgi:uncharacterized protein YkwD
MSPIALQTATRAAAVAALIALVAIVAGPVERGSARGAGCAAQSDGAVHKRSDRAPLPDLRRAVTCLINKKRSAANLRKVRSLQDAAQRHSERMNRQRCYSHQCPGEPNTLDRIRKQGYMRGASSYSVGEVIALVYDSKSPRYVVRAWMNSAGHRSQIMNSSYRHLGVGIVARRGRAFYTVTLGRRSG